MRWGSPLTFPNREVKPNCADGTAVMWESMSPPSFIKRLSEKIASFFCYWYGVFASSVRRLLLLKPQSEKIEAFFLPKSSPDGTFFV